MMLDDQVERFVGEQPREIVVEHAKIQDRFVKGCKALGYNPTRTEVGMYFQRSAFGDNQFEWRFHSLFPKGLTDNLELLDDTLGNLLAWGKNSEIIQDPSIELATHLVTDLFRELQTTGDENYGVERSKKTRDLFVTQGESAIKYPWESTVTYHLIDLSKDPWWVRYNPFLAKERKKAVNLAGQITNDFGFTYGVLARTDLETATGNCMMAYIQIANNSGIKENIAKGLSYLYRQMGLERYSDSVIAKEALEKADQAIEPVRAALLFKINSRIGLSPRRG